MTDPNQKTRVVRVEPVNTAEPDLFVTFDELLALQAAGAVRVRATCIRASLHVELARLAPSWAGGGDDVPPAKLVKA